MNTTLENTTDTAHDLNLADLPPVTAPRYEHLTLLDATHAAETVPALPTRRKKSADWYAGSMIVLMLSALAAAADLLMHLN